MNTVCTICEKESYARGFCKYHYSKSMSSGVLKKLPPKEKKKCCIEGCNEVVSAKERCEKHYRQLRVSNNPSVYKDIEEKRKARSKKRKLDVINMMGGCCSICGYSKNTAALEFHHIDQNEKEYQPKEVLRLKDFEKALSELKKCLLVCRNCHAEIHHPNEVINA